VTVPVGLPVPELRVTVAVMLAVAGGTTAGVLVESVVVVVDWPRLTCMAVELDAAYPSLPK
jgi:hypothetical protein